MTSKDLVAAARLYQEQVVIPHCAVCSRPCCKLDELVLDLDWPRVRALYQITSSRKAFNAALPTNIKEERGTYYAHGQPCPAYDDVTKRCNVYGTDTKPPSCTDFPVYEDGDVITADTRCEAVNLDELQKRLGDVVREHDDEFPVLVTFRPAK